MPFSHPPQSLRARRKKKLRDVVAYLDGYRNGHSQELLDEIKKRIAFNTIPTTDSVFELPDTLIIKTSPYGIESEMLIDTNGKSDFHSFYHKHDIDRFDEDTCLHVLFDDEGEPADFPEYTELRDLPIWQYVCQHYVADHAIIEMPSIEQYGIDHEATDSGALEMLASFYLTPRDNFEVTPFNRDDDGSSTAFILLRRKPKNDCYTVVCNNEGKAITYDDDGTVSVVSVETLIREEAIRLEPLHLSGYPPVEKSVFFDVFDNENFTRVPMDYFDSKPMSDLCVDLMNYSAHALQSKYQERGLEEYPYLGLPYEDWQYECREGNTRLSYWEWVSHNIESMVYSCLRYDQ